MFYQTLQSSEQQALLGEGQGAGAGKVSRTPLQTKDSRYRGLKAWCSCSESAHTLGVTTCQALGWHFYTPSHWV